MVHKSLTFFFNWWNVTTKAKYKAVADAAAEVKWLHGFFI